MLLLLLLMMMATPTWQAVCRPADEYQDKYLSCDECLQKVGPRKCQKKRAMIGKLVMWSRVDAVAMDCNAFDAHMIAMQLMQLDKLIL